MHLLSARFAQNIVVNFLAISLLTNVLGALRGDQPIDDDSQPNSEEPVDHEMVDSLSITDVTTEDPAGVNFAVTTGMTTRLTDEEADEIFYSHYNSTNEVDLVFVLDRSGSVPRVKWNSTIQFVMNTLEHFTVDKDNTRVAVITYSTTVSVDFDDLAPNTDADQETKCTVFQRLENILSRKLPHGYTATSDALNTVYKSLLNSRPRAKKAVIVVTDGKSNIGPPPLKAAVDILSLRWQQVWDQEVFGPQVETFVFGVEELNMAELKSIASSIPNRVFIMSSFRHFAHFARRIHGGK